MSSKSGYWQALPRYVVVHHLSLQSEEEGGYLTEKLCFITKPFASDF
jgi:hypothetical protein